MGSGGGSTTVEASPYEGEMAKIASSLFEQTDPLRASLLTQANKFLGGDYNPQNMPAYAPLYATARNGMESQYGAAKDAILSGTPIGGGLQSALGNLEASRARDVGSIPGMISGNLIQDMMNKTYGTAFGAPGQAMSGLGAAAGMGNSRSMAQAGINAQENAQQNQFMGQLGQGVGALLSTYACCFIFITAQNGLHPVVRRYRDEHMTDRNRRGYYWFADRLVPRMRRSKAWFNAVKWLMVEPMTEYGKYYYGQRKAGIVFAPLTKAWLWLFDVLGRRSPYRRSNGEVV